MIRNRGQLSVDIFWHLVMDSSSDIEESETSVRTRFLRVPSVWLFVIFLDILSCLWIQADMPPPTTESYKGNAAEDNLQTVMPGMHCWYTQANRKESPNWP